MINKQHLLGALYFLLCLLIFGMVAGCKDGARGYTHNYKCTPSQFKIVENQVAECSKGGSYHATCYGWIVRQHCDFSPIMEKGND